ncbi:UV radiation resistance-associated gene protein [Stomoxys calcitrans]|uniref:UV radiation resistance-associated gene protein n=1 Tax=Stomoxys calcitrans TaxID=35570 RepID=UPI0027E2BCF4|nr:UV radiation resistance-associated gene protein [Stomoxys calcitrans]
MNIRPRCREWLPLSTQQLRLRNLQAIQGVNIEVVNSSQSPCCCTSPTTISSCSKCPEKLVYYTLHDHPENEAFYESEKIPLRMYLPLKWAEIQCLSMVKSNANCVCVKVWLWTKKSELNNLDDLVDDKEYADKKEPISALSLEFAKLRRPNKPPGKLLFSWGIFFSGLIPLSLNCEAKCGNNTLIFQMNDELFASPDNFTTENLREQLAMNYERYSASVPKCSIPTPDELTINSPHVSRSSSPVAVDWQRDLLRMSRTRYAQLNCLRSEVRASYDLTKLLRLQQLQRQRLQTQRESIELTADIKRLSLRCITKEQLLRKPRTTSIGLSTSSSTASQYHSMGRTLSLLLAEQQSIDPHQLLRAQELQRQLESLKSRQRLLQSAQDTFSKRITQLRQQLTAATTSRQQLQTWLGGRKRKLNDDKLHLEDFYINQLERRQMKRSIGEQVDRRMSSLCIELKEIYPIAECIGLYTICGVRFPSVEGYVYDSNNPNSVYISDNITPMAISASLGYVGHIVQMISVIINCPLRYPIIHEGSHTRIKDIVRDIPPYASREYPLYSRSSIPTKAVKYAISLLNLNIAQLNYNITGKSCDVRCTIANLLHIFNIFAEIQQNKHQRHSHTRTLPQKRLSITEITNEIDGHQLHENLKHSIKNGEDYSLSKSHSSVDMNHMQPPPPPTLHHHHHLHHHHNHSNKINTYPLTTENLTTHLNSQTIPIDITLERNVMLNNNQQRICRSAGSYTDSEDERDCRSASDSNLTLQTHSGHI